MTDYTSDLIFKNKNPRNLPIANRDISWLSFNERVLQQAASKDVPLFERVRFLAIFSSNLDEFYSVRVAEWRRIENNDQEEEQRLLAQRVLNAIYRIVNNLQENFGRIFWEDIVPQLKQNGIVLKTYPNFNLQEQRYIKRYITSKIGTEPELIPLNSSLDSKVLENRQLYFAIKHTKDIHYEEYFLMKFPKDLPRFIKIGTEKNAQNFCFIDDALRVFLQQRFPSGESEICSIKISRDAELQIEHEDLDDPEDLLNIVKESLELRNIATPTRFLYDSRMDVRFMLQLKDFFKLQNHDLFPGGKYHNFHDLLTFPFPDIAKHNYKPLPPLDHPLLKGNTSVIKTALKQDLLLHFPYHKFDYVIKFLKEAAVNPQVRRISITLYRVANKSKIIENLIKAAQNGKEVHAYVELKARFDEESNIISSKALKNAGVNIHFTDTVIKVHCKILQISIGRGKEKKRICYLSTGNFNEKTAKLYCDSALLTSNPTINNEAKEIFDSLSEEREATALKKLMLAPHQMRNRLYDLIDQEVKNLKEGKPAYMIAKMNGLQDEGMIEKIYDASVAGLKIDLIIRSICCVMPGVKYFGENIKAISIVDRYLEHTRIYVFCNNNNPIVYLSSADWMSRNLKRRIEVAFPIENLRLKREVLKMLELQIQDNTNARILDAEQTNKYKKQGSKKVNAQKDFYNYLKRKSQG